MTRRSLLDSAKRLQVAKRNRSRPFLRQAADEDHIRRRSNKMSKKPNTSTKLLMSKAREGMTIMEATNTTVLPSSTSKKEERRQHMEGRTDGKAIVPSKNDTDEVFGLNPKKDEKSDPFVLNPPPTDVQKIKRKNQRVPVNLFTVKSIKIEAEAIPLPCSVYSLSLALCENENVMWHHMQPLKNGENDSHLLAITERGENSRGFDRRERRKMQLQKVLRELSSSADSIKKQVSNWSEARIVLEEVLNMPLTEEEEEELNNRLEGVHVGSNNEGENDDGKNEVEAAESSSLSIPSAWEPSTESRLRNHYKKKKNGGGKTVPYKRTNHFKKLRNALNSYCDMVTKATQRRHELPPSHKWSQIDSFRIPTQIVQKKIKEEEIKGKESQKEETSTTAIPDLLDQRLEERLAEAEKVARSKSDSQSSYIDSLVVAREQEEEAILKEKEEEERRKKQEEEAKSIASSLLRPLTPEEASIVQNAIYGDGPGSGVLARCEADTVIRDSMRKLRPGQWLNDEVIHYFLVMLSKRDEQMCASDKTKKRCHFFKSFFITKLFDEGNVTTRNAEGTYNYSNVKRWSKRVPGKDIFKLDKIFFPINAGGVHWCCAVVFMTKKRIQFYDSLAGEGMFYLRGLFRYLKDEHKAKKGSPLPDEDEWELVTCTSDTPLQENGFDCGVFTCMYADFLSIDCPLKFSQHHVSQCRERIALSIMNGSAIH